MHAESESEWIVQRGAPPKVRPEVAQHTFRRRGQKRGSSVRDYM